jgi:phospholipid/cholesterol/gamma-HCH transport system substrate-binding protein
MLRGQDTNYVIVFKYLKDMQYFCLVFLSVLFLYFFRQQDSKYSFFIEFNNANGIVVGTPLRMRGINIGFIQNIQLKPDCILVLATINSKNIIISKSCLIETTQTGLLNDTVIDIIPIQQSDSLINDNPSSRFCNSSLIICSNMYFLGSRGLNYDDLVRSTTRISQRFDDPHFFYLFYNFLHRTIELTDSLSIFTKVLFNTFDLNTKIFSRMLDK